MSKVDQLRAMREARYEARQKAQGKQAQGKSTAVKKSVDKPASKPRTPVTISEKEVVGPLDQLCGHMSMSKKMCIRPKDHPEKYHRYGKGDEGK